MMTTHRDCCFIDDLILDMIHIDKSHNGASEIWESARAGDEACAMGVLWMHECEQDPAMDTAVETKLADQPKVHSIKAVSCSFWSSPDYGADERTVQKEECQHSVRRRRTRLSSTETSRSASVICPATNTLKVLHVIHHPRNRRSKLW